MQVNGGNLARFLGKAYLGGMIEEGVLETDGEYSTIFAVDLSNSIVAHLKEKMGLRFNKDIGIGNISLLKKYLDRNKKNDLNVELKKDRLIFSNGADSGELEFLTTTAETIPTSINKEGQQKMAELAGSIVYAVDLSKRIVDAILFPLGLLAPGAVTFEVSRDGVVLKHGLKSEHQFELSLGKPKVAGEAQPFTITVHRKILVAALRQLKFSDGEIPSIGFAPNLPVVIHQNKNNWYLLSNITK